MSAATIALIVEIIQALIAAATAAPEVISAGQTAVSLLSSNSDPTAAQEAQIRAALDTAHAALQGQGSAIA